MPLISIIIPIYNVEKYIHETLGCIINQTFNNWECILVDDGSSDNSPAICDEYAKKDKRIRVIHKPNGGLVSARNAGYDVATGDWMMYVDGDDWLDADCCQIMLDAIAENPDVDILNISFIRNIGEIRNI